MGLLDGLFSDDPQKQAMLQMAMGLLAGAPGQRKNFGADLASAGNMGLQGYNQARVLQQRAQEGAQQRELMGYQLQNARQGIADDQAYRGAIQSAPNFAAPTAPNMAPTPENAAQLKTLSPYDQAAKMVEYLRSKGVNEKNIAPYTAQMEKLRPKFKADQQLIKMPDGSLGTVNMADDGSMQVVPYSPAEKQKEVNLGGAVGLTGEYTGKMGQQYGTTMAPGEIARLGQAERHFQQDFGLKLQTADQGKVPAGYRALPNGSLEFIPGGPADPRAGKATDTERQASGYYDRMAAAEKVMKPVESTSGKPGVRESMMMAIPGIGEAAANSLPEVMGGRSADRQSYRQAQEDWVRAKLRKESGAVIAQDEMAQEIRTYFPQVGDTPQVIAQKARARQTAASGMKTSAGPVAHDSVDDLLKKYLGQ